MGDPEVVPPSARKEAVGTQEKDLPDREVRGTSR
jgi:hypothetical protein